MTTDEDIMESLFSRLRNPSNDTMDELSVEMFCLLVRSNPNLVHKSQEMIISLIRSKNIIEAINGVKLLKECMSRCGIEFQNEIAKFRFLNDLIRLVSLKYDGFLIPLELKKNIMDCLLLWSEEFPAKTKIRDVYDMLLKEMPVKETAITTTQSTLNENTSNNVEIHKTALGIDEQEFSRLIKSNDPENFKRANLLIQHRVSQVSRLAEITAQHKLVLDEVNTTVILLNQMLDVYESDAMKSENDSEEMNLMRELFMACKKHKPIIKGLCAMETASAELIADTLEFNDKLVAVLNRYKNIIVHQKPMKNEQPLTPLSPSMDLIVGKSAENHEELLGINKISPSLYPKSSNFNETDLNELTELFSSIPSNTESGREKKFLGFEEMTALSASEPLIPEKVNNASSSYVAMVDNHKNKISDDLTKSTLPTATLRELKGIDALSAQLFRDLNKNKQMISESSFQQVENAIITEDQTVLTLESPELDQEMLSTISEPILKQSNEMQSSENHFKKLADIELDLEQVIPLAEERLLIDDGDIKITLNFTENRPSLQVSVIVISVINKTKQPMTDFIFEASVKKPAKVRLLPPTNTKLGPFRLFPPPTPINQVMLLLNSTGKAIDVTCIVGYKLGDDPDSIKESLLAKNIPYVN